MALITSWQKGFRNHPFRHTFAQGLAVERLELFKERRIMMMKDRWFKAKRRQRRDDREIVKHFVASVL